MHTAVELGIRVKFGVSWLFRRGWNRRQGAVNIDRSISVLNLGPIDRNSFRRVTPGRNDRIQVDGACRRAICASRDLGGEIRCLNVSSEVGVNERARPGAMELCFSAERDRQGLRTGLSIVS